MVLFIDQFEEVFASTVSEEERQRFFDLITTAVTEPQGALVVVLTLRADFFAQTLRYPTLYRLLDAHRVSVLPMERDDLRRVIEEPAHLPGVQMTFEGDLVGDLLFDMREQIGALPLLEFALDQLFAHRNGPMLTLHAYREIGGVKGALVKHAEATYQALPTTEQRELARSLFLRLVDPGRTEQDTIRRRARLSEFEQPDLVQTKLLREIMDAFVAARLLTTNKQAGEATLEVSHEALIREWPRLTEWLHEAREDILLQQKISEDAAEWQERRRSHDRLYHGSQLKEARAWAKRNAPNQLEGTFLYASRKQQVQFVASMIGVLLMLFATTGTAIYFFIQRSPDPTEVTTLQNDGVGSLRWAIASVPSKSTITFAPSLVGQTITLTDTLTIPNKQLRIQGPDGKRITLSNPSHGTVVDDAASISIINLTFLGGKANFVSLFQNQGTLTLTNSIVSDNGGGGILNYGTLTLTNSIVSDNSGGGIDNYLGTLTLTNSTVSGNSSFLGYGGGISNFWGTLTLTNSTVSGNSSSSSGGGIDNYLGTLTLTNSTVSGNFSSSSGGGINTLDGTVILVFSTLFRNTANIGGGLSIEDDPDLFHTHTRGVSIMSNSLVAGNQAFTGPDIVGDLTTEGYNLIQNTAGTTFSDPDHKYTTDLTNIRLSTCKSQNYSGGICTIILVIRYTKSRWYSWLLP